MRQLIKQEFKKIFKKKYFLVLLLLLLGVSGFLTYNSYNKMYTGEYAIQDDKGVELTGIDALRYIDSERHKYAGVVNKEFTKEFVSDYDNKVKDSIEKNLVYDNEKMTEVYGENYEGIIERAASGDLTAEDWDVINNTNTGWYDVKEGSKTIVYLDIFYKNQGKLSALFSIYDYTNSYFSAFDFIQPWKNNDEMDYNPIEYIENYRFNPFLYKEEYKAKIYPENASEDYEYKSFLDIYDDGNKQVDSRLIDYYNKRFMAAKPYYDSTLPNQYLINNMTDISGILLVILLIIVVLSDMFSYDQQTKSDQIIECSCYGTKKLKLAKLIVGIATALGIIILQQTIIILISNIMLPVRDLSLIESGYDTIANSVTHITRYIESYKDVLITGAIMLLLGGIVMGTLTMFISYVSKNKFITAITMILIIFFLIFISETYLFEEAITTLIPFIPFNFMKFTLFHNFAYNAAYSNDIIPHTILFDNVVAIRDIVIIVWLALCAGMGSFISFVKVGEVKSK